MDRKSYTIEDYYISYKEYTKDSPNYKITKSKFRDILEDYFSYLANDVIDKSKEIRLPARMGTLSVIKKKPKRYDFTYLSVDFNSTRQEGKTILHMNDHSDGYNYKFYWSKRDMLVANKSLYELVMTRRNKRALASKIKNKENDYVER